ncbi:Uncharacterized protein TCAP_03062 [Tolypocladium capitatum]|uniref:Uncharacterized protein n=1 Tax=Tolypocladium capitatum TaxID=45235 RepID=A0A2K3QHK8_9HYPO|nr:Uncharacterized protein TCAP_03062 [Tolypocladium capitatum]
MPPHLPGSTSTETFLSLTVHGRADRRAINREGTAGAAAAAAQLLPSTNGSIPVHNSEQMQRLNRVWARQATLHIKPGAEDAKSYDGIKYERKSNGPFMGKLVSQGTIVNIDGQDYIEYPV